MVDQCKLDSTARSSMCAGSRAHARHVAGSAHVAAAYKCVKYCMYGCSIFSMRASGAGCVYDYAGHAQ
eukprot:6022490-Pleurochrysis_carterae.AAC.1